MAYYECSISLDDIYNAVVSKGQTPISKSSSDIVTAIGNISCSAILLGTYSSSTTINIKSSYPNEYSNFAASNFLVVTTSKSSSFDYSTSTQAVRCAGSYSVTVPSVSYNASTGVLTYTAGKIVSSGTGYGADGAYHGWGFSYSAAVSAKVYLVK